MTVRSQMLELDRGLFVMDYSVNMRQDRGRYLL